MAGSETFQKKAHEADSISQKLKPLAFASAFLLVTAGRWFNLHVVNQGPPGASLPQALVFGAAFGVVAYHLVDLFLARGLLQVRIACVRTTAVYALALALCNRLCLAGALRDFPSLVCLEAAVTLAIGLISVIVDSRLSGREDCVSASGTSPPKRYVGHHPLRTAAETVFRLLPRPEPVGIYAIGNPDEKSDVLVTGNFELTIRRVVRALRGFNCWLLVCDSRGINIWCSSLAGHFSTESVLTAIRQGGLNSLVAHRNVILPQLCAANVSPGEIRSQTGFSCRFGPARIEDFPAYLERPERPGIRRVNFPLRSRVEMAVGTVFLPAILTGLVFNFINPDRLFVILPAFFVLSVVNAVIFPFRFISSVRVWSLLYGSVTFLAVWALCTYVLKIPAITYAVTLGIAGLYFVNEFEGWSPLVKFSVTGAYTSAEIAVSQAKCIGCGTCVDVCPKGVYRVVDGKSTVENPDACCSCKSCFVQCPTGAISHSAAAIP